MKASLKQAIEDIKKAGFSHIKVELEGDIGRDGERECEDCYGDGRTDCDECSGEGYSESGNYTRLSDEAILEECGYCYGDGRVDCSTCEGEGNHGDFMSEETCEDFMKSHVPADVLERLTYGRFYEDGSVDSEFTFTVPIENVEDVTHWMNAFTALADECGTDGVDVRGAGLHIAVLPATSNGEYPCSGHLDRAGIRNFKEQMDKLMPALFFLASAGHQSRDLGYRNPGVSTEKYNAISTGDDRWLEYRVFETCYDKPESFFDYVQVIANSLKFYADPSLTVKSLGKKFGFSDGREVARFYDTPEQLRILNATIKHLKPADKTYKKLKEERGVQYTISGLVSKQQLKMKQLREDYRQYRLNWVARANTPLNQFQQRDYDNFIERGYSRDEANEAVRGNNGRLVTLREFIENNMMGNYDKVFQV